MDSEQILLNMFKQQHQNESRHKMQKIIVTLTALASVVATALTIVFYIRPLYIIIFAGAVVWTIVAVTLARFKVITFNVASYSLMVYACFVIIPGLWAFGGIFDTGPLVSLILIVGILAMFDGRMLKVLIYSFLALLFGLVVYSSIRDMPLSDDVPNMIYATVGYVITVALVMAYLMSKLKHFEEMSDKFLKSSFRDELTRVYNRKLLDIILHYEETLYKKESSEYFLIMFDINDFKKMNDENGHVFGDIVLRNVAKCIQEKVRTTDFVIRYGGDEFLVVQSNASDASRSQFLDRIDEAMSSSCYLDIDVTVSYGCAARSEGNTPEEALMLADKRLYENKSKMKKA